MRNFKLKRFKQCSVTSKQRIVSQSVSLLDSKWADVLLHNE